MKAKVRIAENVTADALQRFEAPALLWTGGKDSTVLLKMVLDYCEMQDDDVPTCLVIDHGQHFPETWEFVNQVAEQWGISVEIAKNEQVLRAIEQRGSSTLSLEDLNPANRSEALLANLEHPKFECSLNTLVGNHLLKTVALKSAVRSRSFEAVFTGIRWDENPARSTEVFLSERHDPPHVRVHPILPFTESDVWTYTQEHTLPVHPLYERGYRSLDGVLDSQPDGSTPAWEQDLERTRERAGRSQDKEEIMRRLRELGYM